MAGIKAINQALKLIPRERGDGKVEHDLDYLLETLPDVRDGLNREQRVILYCLSELQKELKGRSVPSIMLYGRVCEYIDISQSHFQALFEQASNQKGS